MKQVKKKTIFGLTTFTKTDAKSQLKKFDSSKIKELSSNEKLILGLISRLNGIDKADKDKGIFFCKSNFKYLTKLSDSTIKRTTSSLEKKGYISKFIENNNKTWYKVILDTKGNSINNDAKQEQLQDDSTLVETNENTNTMISISKDSIDIVEKQLKSLDDTKGNSIINTKQEPLEEEKEELNSDTVQQISKEQLTTNELKIASIENDKQEPIQEEIKISKELENWIAKANAATTVKELNDATPHGIWTILTLPQREIYHINRHRLDSSYKLISDYSY